MCGICGIVHRDGRPIIESTLRAMNDTLYHRGPDGDGYYIDEHVGLAMRRLSIIDLQTSNQPLYNENKKIAVVFNGEIYNYRDLRQRLTERGHHFRTMGDGETIAHCYEDYGINAPQYLRGQFAFLLWSSEERKLFAARDRMGKKPLYYYYDEHIFICGSEIKALLQHPEVPRQSAFESDGMLALYLAYGYIPAPLTPFQHIRMLPPAHALTLDEKGLSIFPYWQLPEINGPTTSNSMNETDYVEEARQLLDEATRLRLLADVPLGAFLSGGLDSSLVVALMRQHSNGRIRTFSIGFAEDSSFDERPYAQTVAQHVESEHIEFVVQPSAMDLLPRLVWHYDQPFADSSAIPTYLVSQLTREYVTVALNGDGGDELFAGYDRFYAAALVKRLELIPRAVWRSVARAVHYLPEGTSYYAPVKRLRRFVSAAGQPLTRAYFDWVRIYDREDTKHLSGQPDWAPDHFIAYIQSGDNLSGVLRANMLTYLPDDLLIKADRMSMAHSLEARSPFLDHHLVEWAAKLPMNYKLRGRTTKYLLKKVARGLLPDAIIDRPKHGFGAPLGSWLRRDMDLVSDILLSETARMRKLYHESALRTLIADHLSGKRDNGIRLWALLTLEWWHRLFIDPPTIQAP